MKIVVNEKPKDWTECMFAEKNRTDIYYAQCKLSGVSCGLDAYNYCERLMSYEEVNER